MRMMVCMDNETANTLRRILRNARTVAAHADRGAVPGEIVNGRRKAPVVTDAAAWAAYTAAAVAKATADIEAAGYCGIVVEVLELELVAVVYGTPSVAVPL